MTLGQVSVTVPERERVVWVPVRLSAAVEVPVAVSYAWVQGTATRGVDLSVPEGDLVFAPGETLKYLPVQVLPDALVEGPETIGLGLRDAGGNVVVGAPGQLTVTVGASDQQVDALVRPAGDKAFVGDDVIDATGAGQTLRASVRAGGKQVFVVRVANDGNLRNKVLVGAVVRGTSARVRYLLGGKDRTRRLVDGRPLQLRLDPGRYRQVRVVVTVAKGADPGDTVRALVRVVWHGDETRVDAVGAHVRVHR